MKIKRIILDPDPRLRAKNADVTATWEEMEGDVKKMFKVMYSTGIGVGMAAPQVGWNIRLFVMNPDQRTKKPQAQRVFWNPELVELLGDPKVMREGCLSLPNVFGYVARYEKLRLKAMSPTGPVDEIFSGFAAQIVQHEVDHLNGVICMDKFVDEPKVTRKAQEA